MVLPAGHTPGGVERVREFVKTANTRHRARSTLGNSSFTLRRNHRHNVVGTSRLRLTPFF